MKDRPRRLGTMVLAPFRYYSRASPNERLLILTTAGSSIGFGAYGAASILFFVDGLHFSAEWVASLIGAAGLLALVTGLWFGRLADRLGARELTILLSATEAVAVALLAYSPNRLLFTCFILLFIVADRGGNIAWGAMLADIVSAPDRTRVRAILRSVANTGIAVGAGIAAIATTRQELQGYRLVLLGVGLLAAMRAAAFRFLPKSRRRAPSPTAHIFPRWRSADWRANLAFVGMSMIVGLASTGNRLLLIGTPLWLIKNGLPTAWTSGAIVANGVLVILLQVRVSRGAETLGGSGSLLGSSLRTLAIAVALYGVGSLLHGRSALVALAAAVLALTVTELQGVAAGWYLRYQLARPDAQGFYGGLHTAGAAVPVALASPGVAMLVDGGGVAWFLVAGGVLLLGMAAPRLISHASQQIVIRP